VAIPDDIPHESIIRAMSVDKKKSAGAVRFTLPAAIGDVRTGIEVRDLREALASCSAPHVIERLGVGSSPTVNSPTADRQRRGEPG
jgi:hypothetical protein